MPIIDGLPQELLDAVVLGINDPDALSLDSLQDFLRAAMKACTAEAAREAQPAGTGAADSCVSDSESEDYSGSESEDDSESDSEDESDSDSEDASDSAEEESRCRHTESCCSDASESADKESRCSDAESSSSDDSDSDEEESCCSDTESRCNDDSDSDVEESRCSTAETSSCEDGSTDSRDEGMRGAEDCREAKVPASGQERRSPGDACFQAASSGMETAGCDSEFERTMSLLLRP